MTENVLPHHQVSTLKREEDYPKQIDTLIEDIHGLFAKAHTPSEENLNAEHDVPGRDPYGAFT